MEAYSQAEHTALLLQVAGGTLVGSPTNGCNGDITSVALPGGMAARFSGQAVRRPDGGQFQRVGVLPDVLAEPTPEGLRAGRAEVVEAAVRWLGEALQGTTQG